MYVVHKRKSEVLLWCYGDLCEGSMSSTGVEQSDSTRKRPHSETSAPASKRSASIADTINAVEAIIVKLRKKHGESRFSVEKLNCWAHMLNCGKWSSMTIRQSSLFPRNQKESREIAVPLRHQLRKVLPLVLQERRQINSGVCGCNVSISSVSCMYCWSLEP